MSDMLFQLALFTTKIVIIFIFIVAILATFFSLIAKAKEKLKGRLTIRNLNKKYAEIKEEILSETLSKKELKQFLKEKKKEDKQKSKKKKNNMYVLSFHGDIKASSVSTLREEITALLNVATPQDEVVLRLESAGGMVHAYGLATAQLMRLRAQHIPLTVIIDKMAASGGYMMACIANKIFCAPFSILGSIGVVVQLPNFHRLLQDKHIDFEQHTAGEFKRTITMFGENTEAGRKKLQQEIEEMHHLFKNLITTHRPQIDIQKVATGEYWLGQQAIPLKLADEIKTSDDYLFECSKKMNVYEVSYEIKKSFLSKLSANSNSLRENVFKWTT